MEEKKQTKSYELYLLDRQYKDKTNLIKHIEKCQNFYNGKQYPQGQSSHLQVTMNICNQMVEIKASKINGTNIYLTYTADNDKTDCTALRQFDEYNCNKLNLNTENAQAARNGYTNGTEITFLRWDDDDMTYKGVYKGGLKMEHINPIKFAVANPYIQDIQNQEYVMFWSDMPLKALLDILEYREGENKKEKKQELLNEARENYDDSTIDEDLINAALVRVFTRYFRIKGEVYFTLETKYVEIFAYPHPLSRKVGTLMAKKIVKMDEKKQKEQETYRDEYGNLVNDFDIDSEDIAVNTTPKDILTDEDYKQIKEKFSLYPFAVFEPIKVNESFYGRSDIQSLIPIQSSINYMISMVMKCAENNAYNKIFAKPDALQGQEITNEPSQVIIDYSQFTNGWGIKMAESQPLPNGLLDYTDRLFAMTRNVYGFSEVMDGSITNQDMSGYMLQQMIKQSNVPIEQQQKLFWKYNVDMAEIRLMFYKHYVDKAMYTYEYTDSEYQDEESAKSQLYKEFQRNGGKLLSQPNVTAEDLLKPVQKVQHRVMKNEDIYGVGFDISIEAMQGLADSKLIEQQQIDNLMMNGNMQNMSPDLLDFYLEVSPNISPRVKTEAKRMVRVLGESLITKLKEQNAQLIEKLQEAANYIKQVDAKNKYFSEFNKNLQNEFSKKINIQNDMIDALKNDLQKKMQNEANKEQQTQTQPQQQENIV